MTNRLSRAFDDLTTGWRTHSHSPANLTILVVDDEAPIREYLRRVLDTAGHITHMASEADEAMTIAASLGQFDVLVTDLMMPGTRGDELARRLRASEPGLKVLYVTGRSDELFEERSVLWEDEAFLEKPCTPKSVLEAVALVTSGRIPTVAA